MYKSKLFIFIICTTIINICFTNSVIGCKDIIACGDATDGNYNLLLKVRDPSRKGLQVLCIVPEGYEYTYHHPWYNISIDFVTRHKTIGVATKGDIIPNIVKAGMSITDAGLAFGDADTGSNWINPTKYAWDDFDWIRYASDIADDEEQAVLLLTNDVVDNLHATGVSENLFVVGSNTGYIIEGDAVHYNIKKIENGVAVMSNYPKELWNTQIYKKQPIAKSYDSIKEKVVEEGDFISLDSLFHLKIVDIKNNSVIVKQIPFFRYVDKRLVKLGEKIEISIGERKTAGDFSVRIIKIEEEKATINLTTKYKAWEDEMLKNILPSYSSINIKDMINWSRLQKNDLDGLRGMCEKNFIFEAVTIYKIPKSNYDLLSSGWFSPNRAKSSIYVPFHITDDEIFYAYENGEAAQISLDLYNFSINEKNLTDYFSKVEDVFLLENQIAENKSLTLIDNISYLSSFLTFVDTNMQKQAFLTEQIWLIISNISDKNSQKDVINIISNIWDYNYSKSLVEMNKAKSYLQNGPDSEKIIIKIEDLINSINEVNDAIHKN